tara:strand:- start:207 stop:557 length:351 start_codon:yes stop_codon:yes gene_type:complete
MSLYDRFRGKDDAAKLPIWPTISTVAEILSGQITDQQAIERFNLGSVEQQEFAQVKTHVVQKIETIRDSLTAVGLAETTATTISRAVVRNDVTQTLMRAELGYDSREQFNSDLGID